MHTTSAAEISQSFFKLHNHFVILLSFELTLCHKGFKLSVKSIHKSWCFLCGQSTPRFNFTHVV